MECLWLSGKDKYDGSQLQPLHNYLKHGVLGDSVVSWAGPCELKPRHIIDGGDLRSGAKIAGDSMLHFILELFGYPLSGAIAFQRLMGEILINQILFNGDTGSRKPAGDNHPGICGSENQSNMSGQNGDREQSNFQRNPLPDADYKPEDRKLTCFELRRLGDDVYWGERKLNISVATCSNLSSLIHFGVNVTNRGTPVPTCCLNNFGITDEKSFALDFMGSLKGEFAGMKRAGMKVRSF